VTLRNGAKRLVVMPERLTSIGVCRVMRERGKVVADEAAFVRHTLDALTFPV